VFQEYALFPHLTALGNVMTALGHRPRQNRRIRAGELLALVHLSAHASRRPHELSGGERQRVALARALARDPSVLLLDEPFAAVDRSIRRRLQDEIDAVRRTLDAPLVLVTHDFDDVLRLATHVLLLERGRQVAVGPIAELTGRPDLTWLRQAVGLGSVFDAVVSRGSAAGGLAELAFDGGVLVASAPGVAAGATVRVRIPAREVILASHAPQGLSLHNVLAGTVTAVHPDVAFEHVMVQVAVGGTSLLAEVTRDAVARLGITSGAPIHALVKSVSIGVQPAASRRTSMPGTPPP
jgi:molybdate transport system ATP-binding protein